MLSPYFVGIDEGRTKKRRMQRERMTSMCHPLPLRMSRPVAGRSQFATVTVDEALTVVPSRVYVAVMTVSPGPWRPVTSPLAV